MHTSLLVCLQYLVVCFAAKSTRKCVSVFRKDLFEVLEIRQENLICSNRCIS